MFKKMTSIFLILTLLGIPESMASKIQQQGIVTHTDCNARGVSDANCIPTSDQVYDTTNGQLLTASISGGLLGGGSGGAAIELLTNTGFESGLSGYTASGGSASTVNSGSNLIAGSKSASWQASASSQTFSSSAMSIKGLAGGQCSAQLYYLYSGTAGDYTFEVIDGSSNILASSSLGVQSLANSPVILSFPCGGTTSSTLQWQIVSNVSSPGTIYMDTLHLGSLTVQQLNQPNLYGGVVISGCVSQLTNTSSGSFASLTGSGCTYTPFGNVQSSGSQTVSFKMSGAAADYKVELDAQLGNSLSTDNTYFQLTDGTNVSREIDTVTGGGGLGGNLVSQTIPESSAFTNFTFEFKAKAAAGTATVTTANQIAVIRVYQYPSSATSTVSVGQQPQNWSGFYTAVGTWTTTSATYADFTSGTSNVLTQRKNNNFGSVTQSGTSPSIVFTPSTAAVYWVCVQGQGTNASGPANGAVALTDGSNNIISQQALVQLSGASQHFSLCGIYSAASVASQTLKLRGATASGTLALNFFSGVTGILEWSIVNISSAISAAQFNGPGSITNSSTSALREEVADLTCSSGSSIVSQIGSWVSSIGNISSGACSVTLNSGFFSSAPYCFGTGQNNSANGGGNDLVINTKTTSATALTVSCVVAGASATSCTVHVLCIGPH